MDKTPVSGACARSRRIAAARLAGIGLALAAVAAVGAPSATRAQGPGLPAAPGCTPAGGLQFICGLANAEDMVATPGRRWLIATSFKRDGAALYVIDAKHRTAKPADLSIASGAGAAPFDGCPAPNLKAMMTHGIEIRPGKGGVHTLYVVNHEGRESIEVFSADVRGAEPKIQWTGCIQMPVGFSSNGLIALADGVLAISKFDDSTDKQAYNKLMAGAVSGKVVLWTPGKGLTDVPGTEFSGDNGMVASPDGKMFYLAVYGTRDIVRLAFDGSAKPVSIKVPYRPDNLRWDTNGKILVGGQYVETADDFRGHLHGWQVDSLDPKTMTLTKVIRHDGMLEFDNTTTAIRAGGQLWFGSFGADRLAYMPYH